MSKRLVAALTFAFASLLSPSLVQADSWTDGQAEWARHGSKHGAWDCNGDCPSGRAHRAHAAARPVVRTGMSMGMRRNDFDGVWVVSAAGPCLSAGTSQVMISGGRIMGQNGGGHVSPDGAVQTVGNVGGLTVVGQGQILGRSGSGVYQQSDGCTSSWSAVKL